jgi:hypothetical protein
MYTRVRADIAVNGGSDCHHWSFSSPVVVSTSDSRNSGQQPKQIFEMDVHCCTSSRGEYAAGCGATSGHDIERHETAHTCIGEGSRYFVAEWGQFYGGAGPGAQPRNLPRLAPRPMRAT